MGMIKTAQADLRYFLRLILQLSILGLAKVTTWLSDWLLLSRHCL